MHFFLKAYSISYQGNGICILNSETIKYIFLNFTARLQLQNIRMPSEHA